MYQYTILLIARKQGTKPFGFRVPTSKTSCCDGEKKEKRREWHENLCKVRAPLFGHLNL